MQGRVARASLLVTVGAFYLYACGSTTSTSAPPGPQGDAGCSNQFTIDVHDDIATPPDGVSACPAGSCNYQAATGCAAGLACRPQFTAESTAVSPGCEPAGSGTQGSACASGAECAAGYFCAEGLCRKQCCAGDWSACGDGESCIRQVQVRAGGQVVDSGLALCYPVNDCDPLETGPCKGSSSRECKIVDPIGNVACEPLSGAREGDLCHGGTVCAAGLSCVLDACRALCSADACGGVICASGQGGCVHFNRDPAGVGECTPGR